MSMKEGLWLGWAPSARGKSTNAAALMIDYLLINNLTLDLMKGV